MPVPLPTLTSLPVRLRSPPCRATGLPPRRRHGTPERCGHGPPARFNPRLHSAPMPDAPLIPATHQIAAKFRDEIDRIRAHFFRAIRRAGRCFAIRRLRKSCRSAKRRRPRAGASRNIRTARRYSNSCAKPIACRPPATIRAQQPPSPRAFPAPRQGRPLHQLGRVHRAHGLRRPRPLRRAPRRESRLHEPAHALRGYRSLRGKSARLRRPELNPG